MCIRYRCICIYYNPIQEDHPLRKCNSQWSALWGFNVCKWPLRYPCRSAGSTKVCHIWVPFFSDHIFHICRRMCILCMCYIMHVRESCVTHVHPEKYIILWKWQNIQQELFFPSKLVFHISRYICTLYMHIKFWQVIKTKQISCKRLYPG